MRQIPAEGTASTVSDVLVQGVVAQEQQLRAEIATQSASDGTDSAAADRLLERQQSLNALARQVL